MDGSPRSTPYHMAQAAIGKGVGSEMPGMVGGGVRGGYDEPSADRLYGAKGTLGMGTTMKMKNRRSKQDN